MPMKRLRVIPAALVLAALSHSVLAAAPVIFSNVSNLAPNTAGQQVQLFITGGDQIVGEDLNVEINGGTTGPVITGADILGSTIFSGNNEGQIQIGIVNSGTLAGHAAFLSTTTNPGGTVIDNGLLLTLTLNTSALSSGTFDLNLINTANGASDLVLPNATTIDLSQSYTHIHFSIGSVDRQWQGPMNGNGTGTWSPDGNWAPFAPYAPGDAADFYGVTASAGTTTATVTVDGPRVVGTLNFNNTSMSYSLIPQNATVGSLELNNNASAPMINDSAGSHTISAPITLDGSTNVTVVRPTDVMTLSGAISGAASNLLVGGGGKVILSGNNSYAATSIAVGSALQVGAGSNTGTLGTGAVTDNGSLVFNRSDAPTVANVISGSGGITTSGSGTVVLTAPANIGGVASASVGQLEFGGGVTHNVGAVNIASTLQVDAGTTLRSNGVQSSGNWNIVGAQQIRSDGTSLGASKVGSLTLAGATSAWTGKLDITNNLLAVEATAGNKAAQLAQILNQVTNNSNATSGIMSSTLPLTPGTAIAVVDNGNTPTPKSVMRGQTLDANSIIVVQALQGDTNLDGSVNFTDLVTLEQFYNFPQAQRGWAQGGSTGNGSFADLVALEQNYNHTFGTFSVTPGGSGSLAPSTGSGGASSPVPEPASLAVLALGGGALLTRRRRKSV